MGREGKIRLHIYQKAAMELHAEQTDVQMSVQAGGGRRGNQSGCTCTHVVYATTAATEAEAAATEAKAVNASGMQSKTKVEGGVGPKHTHTHAQAYKHKF